MMTTSFPGVVRLGPVPVPTPPASPQDLEEARRLRKEQKRVDDATRPLDSWERYRALNDAIDEAYDLVDNANREARLALIIVGALNAALFVVASRLDIAAGLSADGRPWLVGAFVVYAAASVYFLLGAIDTLQPRGARSVRPNPPAQIGQLNADLARRLRELSLNNEAKQGGLHRLHGSLRVVTVAAAALLLLLGFFTSF